MTNQISCAHHITLLFSQILVIGGYAVTLISDDLIHSANWNVASIENDLHKTRGLWEECIFLSTSGGSQCTEIERDITYLKFARWAICIAVFLSSIAMVLSLLSNPAMKCFKVHSKILTFVMAALLLVSAGLTLASYSWYIDAANNNYVNGEIGIGRRAPSGRNSGSKNKGKKRKGRAASPFNNVSQWDFGWGIWVGLFTSIFQFFIAFYSVYVGYIMKDFDEVHGEHEEIRDLKLGDEIINQNYRMPQGASYHQSPARHVSYQRNTFQDQDYI